MNTWKLALKEYNEGKKYSIPKKGSVEYDQVKQIQARLDGTSTKPKQGKKVGGKVGSTQPVQTGLPMTELPQTPVYFGDGFVKDAFTGLVKKINNTIDKTIPPVEGDIPLESGEFHAKKIVRKDGKIKRQNYNWAGPGTQVEKRLARGDPPIDGIDAAARQHDIDYTLNFQRKMKEGKKVSKAEVQKADADFVARTQKSKKDNPIFATAIKPLFATKRVAENTGVLSHTSFFDPNTTGSGMKKGKSGKK